MTTSDYGSLDPEIAAAWLSSLDVSFGTKRDYDLAFRTFCKFIDSCAYDFDTLDEQNVLDFKSYLLNERRLSPSATSLYLSGVRSFYRFAESRGLENIARNVHGSKRPRHFLKNNLSVEQARALIRSFGVPTTQQDSRDLAIVSLMLHTGIRDVEIARAYIGDMTTMSGYDVLRVRGKGRDDADDFVKLSPALYGQIREYLAIRGVVSRPELPLFASVSRRNKGGMLTTRSISRIVKNSLRRIGIDDPHYTAHSLRHSAITFALLAGADLEDAQAMARHADISTTMIYSHHVNRLANAAEDKISSLLDSAE